MRYLFSITSAMIIASVAAQAALLLNPGAIAFPAPSPAVLGPLVASTTDSVTDDLGNFSATVTTDVYSGGSNPLGGLTFVYTVSNDPDGAPVNSDLLGLAIRFLPAYIPASVDIDSTLVPGVAPTVALLAGQTLGFLFGSTSIPEGASSVQLVVGTSYPDYAASVGSVIDGTSEDVTLFVPVPEPAHYAGLAALGLLGYSIIRRRNRA